MLWLLLLYMVQMPQRFIPPIDTMADVKGDIVYADRKFPFFLIVNGNRFYIGHPTFEGALAPGEDVSYNWGELEDCSTGIVVCRSAGAIALITSGGNLEPVSFADRRTVVSAWPDSTGGGWSGAGSDSSYPDKNLAAHTPRNQPLLTYQYAVDGKGTVTRILVNYWRLGTSTPVTRELRLETKQGIRLSR